MKKIKIGGRYVEVRYVDGEENFPNGELGMSFIDKGIIKIDKSLPQDFQKSVLLHEIIEFIDSMWELKLEHKTITCLETALYQVLKDNKLIF